MGVHFIHVSLRFKVNSEMFEIKSHLFVNYLYIHRVPPSQRSVYAKRLVGNGCTLLLCVDLVYEKQWYPGLCCHRTPEKSRQDSHVLHSVNKFVSCCIPQRKQVARHIFTLNKSAHEQNIYVFKGCWRNAKLLFFTLAKKRRLTLTLPCPCSL